MASVNKHVNYKLITSIAAATLLGLIELQSQTVKAEVNDTSLIIQQRVNQDDNNDPLFNGADVSNGYIQNLLSALQLLQRIRNITQD